MFLRLADTMKKSGNIGFHIDKSLLNSWRMDSFRIGESKTSYCKFISFYVIHFIVDWLC